MDYFVAPERFETAGFVIRSYQPGDGALLNDATQSSYEFLHTYMAWAKPDVTVEESEKAVRQMRGKYLLAQDFTLGIFAPDDTRQLGSTGFHLRNNSLPQGTAEIGMWLRGDAAGQGLGTAALLAMLEWGFSEWSWRRIIWRCDSTNVASMRTAQKAGMRQEAHFVQDTHAEAGSDEWRDTLSFALLHDEWKVRTQS